MAWSSIIVTRGNVDLRHVTKSLATFDEVKVVDNSKRTIDLKIFSWYLAAGDAKWNLLYYQDDDVIVSQPREVTNAWQPGRIICNMPVEFQAAYKDKPDKLMGFGCAFDRYLITETFERYLKHFPVDAVTMREANRIFTALNQDRITMVDVPKTNMPWATDDDRLWKQPDHGEMHREAIKRVQYILDRERSQ